MLGPWCDWPRPFAASLDWGTKLDCMLMCRITRDEMYAKSCYKKGAVDLRLRIEIKSVSRVCDCNASFEVLQLFLINGCSPVLPPLSGKNRKERNSAFGDPSPIESGVNGWMSRAYVLLFEQKEIPSYSAEPTG